MTPSSITKTNNNSSIRASAQSKTGLNTLFESAREYYVKGDYKNADIFFERVLEIDPNHIEALNNKGILRSRLADYDKARNCFEKVLRVDPNNIVALNSLEILNNKKGGTTTQQKEKPAPPPPSSTSGTTSGVDPRNPYNDPTLPYYNPGLGKGTDTMQSIEKPSQSSSTNDALTWNDKGMSLYNSDKYEEAIKSYDKAIELDPNLAMAWHNKGNVLYTLDRPEEAIKSYDKAIELDPNLASALFIRASIKAKKGETENALSDLKKAIAIDKEYIDSAKQANDFENIRNDERFKDLIVK